MADTPLEGSAELNINNFLEGGVTYNESLQGDVTDDYSAPLSARTSVTRSNRSGSVSMPQGLRLCLLDGGSVTITDNAGKNSVTIDSAQQAEIQGFQGGVIRIENTQDVQVTATQARVTLSGTISNLDLTQCEVQLFDGTLTQVVFTNCDLQSYNNTYKQATISGGINRSEGDTFSGQCDVNQNAKVFFLKAIFEDDLTMDTCSGTLLDPQIQGRLTCTGAIISMTEGLVAKALSLSSQSKGVFTGDITFKDQTTLNNSTAIFTGTTHEAELTVTGSIINGSGITAQAALSLDSTSSALMSESTFQDVTTEGSSHNFKDCTFNGTVSGTGSSWMSSGSQGTGTFTQAGGTIDLSDDNWSTINATGLTGPNVLSSIQGASSILLHGGASCSVNLRETDSDSVTVVGVDQTVITNCTASLLTLNGGAQHVLSGGSIQEATFSNTPFVNASKCSIQTATFQAVQMALTSGITDLTSIDSNVIDNESTAQATGGTFTGTGSDLQCSGTLGILSGGTFTATDSSFILSCGASGTNDNLTAGNGFDYTTQASSLLSDGTNTTLCTAIGNTQIFALAGDVVLQAFVGNITSTAAGGILNGAVLGIVNTAGTTISSAAPNITLTAATTIAMSSPAINVTTAAWSWL